MLGFLDDFGIVSPYQLRSMLTLAGSGAAGMVVAGFGATKLPARFTSGKVRSAIEIGSGLVLGRLAWDMNEDVARGVTSGVAGLGVARLLADLTGQSL